MIHKKYTIREIWFPEICLKKKEISDTSRKEIVALAVFTKLLIVFDIIFPILWPEKINIEIVIISISLIIASYSLFAPKILENISKVRA